MPDNEFRRGLDKFATIFALIVFGPFIVTVMAMAAFNAIAPFLPLALLVLSFGGAGYLYYRYRTSPFTIRREHEQEVLAWLARAEAQQQALPQNVHAELVARLRQLRPADSPALLDAMTAPAEAIYAEEFLRMLPPMPPVPLHPEKIYDEDYDRRTLKKGEEPPHRERRDAKGRPTTLELEEFKAFLIRFIDSTNDPQTTVTLFVETYAAFLATLLALLPAGGAAAASFTVPLIDFLPDAGRTVSAAIGVLFAQKIRNRQHFSTIREAFDRNQRTVSTAILKERDLAEGKTVNPDKFPGAARDLLEAYLAGTGLQPLFLLPVPFALPPEKRFEGHWIVARQGTGKTNALECLIAADLAEVAAGRASVVVIDSQGTTADTLLGRLSGLRAFAPGEALAGKLIYLEPDLEYPLALNIFDIGLADLGRLSASQREDIVASACEVVEFLFTGLLGGELSDNMTMLYKYLVPAMLAIPGADMNVFIELLDTDATRDRPVPEGYRKYRAHFARLEPEIRSFLETDYLKDAELVKTKAAVRRRLRAAMADTTFRRMFMQPANKLNLFSELQAGKVILVNTFPAKSYVEPFGRLILALLMQATRQRLEIDREARLPTYVYVDECQDYIAKEERIARYIDKCRKQNVGLVFANQRLANIENARVRNALSGVAIKFAGASDADDAELAELTATTADRIRQLPRGTFAAYVSGLTPRGIELQFPLSPLDRATQLSRAEWQQMRSAMRERYAVRYRAEQAPPADDSPAPPPPIPPQKPSDGAPRRKVDPPVPDDDYDPLQ